MNGIIDALINFEPGRLWGLVVEVLNNPLANLQASLLLLAALVVLTLLGIGAAVLFVGFGDDEDDDEYEEESDQEAGREGGASAPTRGERAAAREAERERREKARDDARAALTPAEKRWRLTTATMLWVVTLLAALVLTGLTTGIDSMCLSCHEKGMPHAQRLLKTKTDDPHVKVACIRCHESGGTVARYTTAVPGRALHFVSAMLSMRSAKSYGKPITSAACASCHGDAIKDTVTVKDRGVRMSHKEPLGAGAVCVDCHEIQITTGAVGSWTKGMSPCLRCHDDKVATAKCDDCHVKDIAFAVHVNYKPRQSQLVPDVRCDSCHDSEKCDSCHGIHMPHSHDFMEDGHALPATLDIWNNGQRTCKKCHTATRNPCSDCHKKGTSPGHPTEAWRAAHGGNPNASDSCNLCHGYLSRLNGENFCYLCHKDQPRFIDQ